MKILLTGGGTGGHFYPLIAIAQRIYEIADKDKVVGLQLYYMSDAPYNKRLLFENKITFIKVPAGKMRTYFSVSNFFDYFKTAFGALVGIISMFFVFPDVVISKGGYASFPAVFAARFFGIPVIVHESDSHPGRLNVWTSKFAWRVAISWPEAAEYLPKDKTALTGQPIRKEILNKEDSKRAHEFYKLSMDIPTILVLGGSQGAETINNMIVDTLPELLKRYQIIHQTGVKNIDEVKIRSNMLLNNDPNMSRYLPIPYLNSLETSMAAGCADAIISRGGSYLFEIAAWGIPSIVIPITNSNGDHQRKNAYNYARAGACEVIEESNLTSHLFVAEIDKLFASKEKFAKMKVDALAFATKDAAEKIAQSAMDIAYNHEQQQK